MHLLLSIFLILLPGIIGNIPIFFCPLGKDTGKDIKIRPPALVFSIVWPILYILLGISFWLSIMNVNENQIIYISRIICFLLLFILLALWIVFYSCMDNKFLGVYIIYLSILFCLIIYTLCDDIISKLCIIPLFVWLLIAVNLNILDVIKE